MTAKDDLDRFIDSREAKSPGFANQVWYRQLLSRIEGRAGYKREEWVLRFLIRNRLP